MTRGRALTPRGSLGAGIQLPIPAPRQSVVQAQQHIRKHAADGTACPCCGRLVKIYFRPLHSEMAAFLCRLVALSGSNLLWYHIRDILPGGRTTQKASSDGAYLVHWGLVATRAPAKGRASAGLYRPTRAGVAFAKGASVVPSHVYLFNNKVVTFSSYTVDIYEALGSEFDYDALMNP